MKEKGREEQVGEGKNPAEGRWRGTAGGRDVPRERGEARRTVGSQER